MPFKEWLPKCRQDGCFTNVQNQSGYCVTHRMKTCKACGTKFSPGQSNEYCANHRKGKNKERKRDGSIFAAGGYEV
jgi:hypothetical protein